MYDCCFLLAAIVMAISPLRKAAVFGGNDVTSGVYGDLTISPAG